MMDTDRLLEEIGPEALGRGLDERMRAIQEAALRYEVPFYETDVGKSSVKALLTAGAPSSTGHDEERMLRTLREIMEQDGLVPMRIGVNTGKVFTGDFGPPYRRAYRVFGDAINTAARVMSKADAGQILSTEIVLNRSRTIFEATPIAPFAAKGKSEPVKASIVGPAIGVKESHHGGVALLGREAEFDVAARRRRSARGGHAVRSSRSPASPGWARPGSSRRSSRGSPDFRSSARAARSTRRRRRTSRSGRSSAASSSVDADADTDDVVARLREAVDRRIDATSSPWIPLLGILLGIDLPDTPETAALERRFLRDRLAEVAFRFLGSLFGAPTIFVIEDAQHLDEASPGPAAAPLAGGARTCRQVLIVTRRGRRRGLRRPRTTIGHADVDRRSSSGRSPLRPLIGDPRGGHGGRSAAPARGRGDRPALRRESAVPVRAPRDGPRRPAPSRRCPTPSSR